MTINVVNFSSNQMHSDAINSENASTHQQKKSSSSSTVKNSYRIGFSAPACLTALVVFNQKFTQDLTSGIKLVNDWTSRAVLEPLEKFFSTTCPPNSSNQSKTCTYPSSPFMQYANSAWTSGIKYLSQETGKQIFNHKITYGEAGGALVSAFVIGLAIKHFYQKEKPSIPTPSA